MDRRRFLGQAGLGIGMAALGELLQRDLFAQGLVFESRIPDPESRDRRPARPSAFRAEGQARHLPVPERGAVAARSVRLQAAACQGAGHRSPRVDPQRPAPDGDDRGTNELPDRAVDLQVCAARTVGRVAQRVASAHCEDCRRSVFHQVDPHRADQPRSGGHVRADGISARRPAEPGSLGLLWARHAQPGSPGFCRDDHRQRSVSGRAAMGHRLSSQQVPGSQAAIGRRPGALRLEPGGLRDLAARTVHPGSGAAESGRVRRHSESRDRDADRAVRDGVPHAELGARAHRSLEGARAHVRALRPRLQKARDLRGELSAGAAPGRTRRAFHSALSPRLGSSLRAAAGHQDDVPAGRSAERRLDSGSEGARPARRHAGHLGR